MQYSLALVTSVACALPAVLLYGALQPFLASFNRLHEWRADRVRLGEACGSRTRHWSRERSNLRL